MKKIFAISLIAMTAVTAANAEIASKAYVDQERDVAKQYTDTKVGNISTYGSATDVATAIANAIQSGTNNAVTRSGSDAVGSATVPVYVNDSGVVTPTTLGTMALENTDSYYTKTAADSQFVEAPATAVTAGTYPKVTVDAQGLVTAGTTLSADDIPSLTLSKISDAGTLAGLSEVAEANLASALASKINGKADSSFVGELPQGATATTIAGYIDEAVEGANTAMDTRVDSLETKVGDANSGLTKGVADNAAAIAALGSLSALDEVAEANLASELASKINGKADKATTLEGYGITDAYTKTAADAAFDAKDAASTAQTAIETKLGAGANGYAIDAKTLKVSGADVLTATDIANKADKATTLAGYGITDGVQSNTAIQASSANSIVQYDAKGLVVSGTAAGNLATKDTIANADVADNAAIDMSKIAMPTTIANGSTEAWGTYSLTADVGANGITYKWELIQRASGN